MTATQLVNPDIDRVDAVNGPATGLPFLMFKSLDAPVQAEPEEALAVEVAKSEAPAEEAAPAEDVVKSEEAPTEEAAPAEEVAKSAEEVAFKAWKAAQAPAEEAAPAEEVAKSTEEVAAPVEEVAKSVGHLPSGLQEILDTFVESYCRYKEAMASGAAAQMAVDGTVEDHLKPAVASADIPVTPAVPVVPEAPVAEEAPPAEVNAPPAEAEKPAEEAPAASETPEEPKAEEKAPAAAEAPAEAPAEEEEEKPPFPPKKVAKSMDELIAEAVTKAIAEAQEPLLKKIDILERTPVDSGPMFAGQIPGTAGNPLLGRGQAEGDPAQGLVNKSAGTQAAPGAYALAAGLKAIHTGKL